MDIRNDRVRKSFAAINYKSELLSEVFLDLLFTRHSEIRPLFGHVRMDEQMKLSVRTLVIILRNMDDDDFLRDYLRGWGLIHRAHGVTPEMYEWGGECLVEAMKTVSRERWNDEIESAWKEAYAAISAILVEGLKVE